MKKVLGKSFLSYEELKTLLCDVETVINSRPLVCVSKEDLNESLTPYHLIYKIFFWKHKILQKIWKAYHVESNICKHYLRVTGTGLNNPI